MIPSASGLPVEQTLQQLAQIEEFRAELGDVKRGEKRRNEEEQMEVDQQRRVKKRQRNDGEEEDVHNFETTSSSCAAASSSSKEIDKLLEIILWPHCLDFCFVGWFLKFYEFKNILLNVI